MQANRNEYNFDRPDGFDFELVIETLKRLKEGKSVEVPIYNFSTHSREKIKVGLLYIVSCFLLIVIQCHAVAISART